MYVLDEKDTWAQIATIWDYFVQFFRPKTEDFRDVTAYELAGDGETLRSRSERAPARLDVWQRRVELPNAVVEQRDGAWLDSAGRVLGTCQHIPRRQDRALAKELAEKASVL